MGPPGDHCRLDRLSSFSGGRDQAALRDPLPWHFLWWIWQHPELARNVKPVTWLISAEEIAAAQKDWHAACEICFRHATHRSKEIQRVMRVHRNPFEPIMCVLEAGSPLAQYRKITDEIIKRMPTKGVILVPPPRLCDPSSCCASAFISVSGRRTCGSCWSVREGTSQPPSAGSKK